MEGNNKRKDCISSTTYNIFSPMGQFMQDIYTFSYTVKNTHDDSIDAVQHLQKDT